MAHAPLREAPKPSRERRRYCVCAFKRAPLSAGRIHVSKSPGGLLVPGDSGGNGTLSRRRRHPWHRSLSPPIAQSLSSRQNRPCPGCPSVRNVRPRYARMCAHVKSECLPKCLRNMHLRASRWPRTGLHRCTGAAARAGGWARGSLCAACFKGVKGHLVVEILGSRSIR
jgi:hypothetical protein